MTQYILKSALVLELERRIKRCAKQREDMLNVQCQTLADDASARMGELRCFQDFLDTLEVKEVDLIIHTIIAECCDWLAISTNLSHDEIESCRNLMLTVKEEQFKEQKGEEVCGLK